MKCDSKRGIERPTKPEEVGRPGRLDRPQTEAVAGEVVADVLHHRVALGAREPAREVLHHRRIVVEGGERRAVALAPAAQDQAGRFEHGHGASLDHRAMIPGAAAGVNRRAA